MNPLRTKRMELQPATLAMAMAERDDVESFAQLLGAKVASWPPPLHDADSMKWMIELLTAKTDAVGWALWYFLHTDSDNTMSAIGCGGFKGPPDAEGTAEIGYSVLETKQQKGFATEAVQALIGWAFADNRVKRIQAQTLPHLLPSRRVLEKCGFRFVGLGPAPPDADEPEAILYELHAVDFAARQASF